MSNSNPFVCTLPEDAEMTMNVWYLLDEPSGQVMGTILRAYVMRGTDQAKYALLQQLAHTDFVCGEVIPVTRTTDVIGRMDGGSQIPGVPIAGLRLEGGYTLIGKEIDALASKIEKQFGFAICESPLSVCTCIRYGDNNELEVIGTN